MFPLEHVINNTKYEFIDETEEHELDNPEIAIASVNYRMDSNFGYE